MAAPKADTRTRAKKARQKAFLKAYAICGVVTQAAEAANIDRSIVYRDWLKEEGADADGFRTAFDDAREQATDRLEQEAIRRATEGYEEYITCSRGLVFDPETGEPLKQRRFSDSLMQLVLKGNRPDKYRERQSIEHSGQVTTIQQLLSDIATPTQEGDDGAA